MSNQKPTTPQRVTGNYIKVDEVTPKPGSQHTGVQIDLNIKAQPNHRLLGVMIGSLLSTVRNSIFKGNDMAWYLFMDAVMMEATAADVEFAKGNDVVVPRFKPTIVPITTKKG